MGQTIAPPEVFWTGGEVAQDRNHRNRLSGCPRQWRGVGEGGRGPMGAFELQRDLAQCFHYAVQYQSDSLRIGLTSEDPLPDHVLASVSPYITVKAEASCRSYSHNILVFNRDAVDVPTLPFDPSARIELHCGRHGVVRGSRPGPLYVDTVEEDLSYIIDRKSVLVLGNMAETAVQFDLIRIIRGVFEAMLHDLGYSKLHMGQLRVRDIGVGICGPKGSGKTTLICRTLASIPEVSFCSNDKSYVSVQDGTVTAIGMPQRIGIQDGTLSEYPDLLRRISLRSGQKTYVWPHDFSETFGTPVIPSNGVDLILTPDFDLSQSTVKIGRLDAGAVDDLLSHDVLEFTDNVHPRWLTDLLQEAEAQLGAKDQMKRALAAIPWYKISGNFSCGTFSSAVIALVESARTRPCEEAEQRRSH